LANAVADRIEQVDGFKQVVDVGARLGEGRDFVANGFQRIPEAFGGGLDFIELRPGG